MASKQPKQPLIIQVNGNLDSIPESDMAVLRTRLQMAGKKLGENIGREVDVRIMLDDLHQTNGKAASPTAPEDNNGDSSEQSIADRARQYKAQKPLYSFEQLVLAEEVKENLLSQVDAIEVESIVFEEWNLKKFQPNPRTVLNFYGPPGTGKTLAAHAIADRLNKQIMLASYADIESKFHGDGPKNLKAIFHAAQRDNAILFVDEADSLLSQRLTEVHSGSEQAINSMRSQLLICLEAHRGIVIFATNLVENYDKAFNTRVRQIHFPMPSENARREIWKRHLPAELPLAKDVSIEELAKIDEICGREIREAVIDAANRAALRTKKEGKHPGQGIVKQQDLVEAIERKKAERLATEPEKLDPAEEEELNQKILEALAKQEKTSENGKAESVKS